MHNFEWLKKALFVSWFSGWLHWHQLTKKELFLVIQNYALLSYLERPLLTYCFDKIQTQPNINKFRMNKKATLNCSFGTYQKENMRYFILQSKNNLGYINSGGSIFCAISFYFLFKIFLFQNSVSKFLFQNFYFNISVSKFQFQNFSFKISFKKFSFSKIYWLY